MHICAPIPPGFWAARPVRWRLLRAGRCCRGVACAGFAFASSEVGRPIYLDRVALDFPELAIVGGHIGYPWTDEAITVATKHENVYIDTSAYTAKRYPAALVEFMRGPGRHKVLFGTNYPMIMPDKALEGLDSLGLSEETQALFLAGNVQRVFKLEFSVNCP